MVTLILATAFAGGTRLDMPVPLHPHPTDTNTCAVVRGADLDVPNTTVDDGRWEVSCQARDGDYMVCLKVLKTHTPRKPMPLRCEGERTFLEVKPFVAYDRNDDPRDGVAVVKGTREAIFFATDLPASEGRMMHGLCSVRSATLPSGETLTFFVVRPVRKLRKDVVCTLELPEGPFDVPIRVVKSAEDLQQAPQAPVVP